MRVLLVGAGGVGSAFVKIAARRDFIESLVVADIDGARAAEVAATFSGSVGKPAYKSASVPTSSTNSPLLRYIRYMVTLGTSTSQVSFSITGLARRGLRVG